jgi:hypothetical protein
MRAAQFGSHQFQRPSRATAAGVRTPRMMVASIRIPPPSAVAKIFASVPGWRLKAGIGRTGRLVTSAALILFLVSSGTCGPGGQRVAADDVVCDSSHRPGS